MVYTIFGFDYIFDIPTYQMLLLGSIMGLYIRLLLSIISHQTWLRNYSQYIVFSILPITGYIITSVISNNIALSLGMVGALSIVRFRTPVKNPSELVIYFCLITIGIVINVNPNIATNFVIFLTFIIIATEVFRFFSKKLNLNPFDNIDDDLLILTINSKSKNDDVEKRNDLIHVSFDKDYTYRFKSKDKETLLSILKNFPKDNILSYSIDAYE